MGGRQIRLLFGGGPTLSASIARLFAKDGMSIALAARNNAEWCDAVTRSRGGTSRFGLTFGRRQFAFDVVHEVEEFARFPGAVALCEPHTRRIAAGIVDSVIERGECDCGSAA